MKVLFICKYNVGRSQIAQAFFNKFTNTKQSTSAGINAKNLESISLSRHSPFVIRSMKEEGIDLSKNSPKQLTESMVKAADKIIIMVKKEDLPDYLKKAKKTSYWKIEDARDKSYEFHVKIRNQIKNLVQKLIKDHE